MTESEQPMETAPRDGTAIMIKCEDNSETLAWWYDLEPGYVGWYFGETGDQKLIEVHGAAVSWTPA